MKRRENQAERSSSGTIRISSAERRSLVALELIQVLRAEIAPSPFFQAVFSNDLSEAIAVATVYEISLLADLSRILSENRISRLMFHPFVLYRGDFVLGMARKVRPTTIACPFCWSPILNKPEKALSRCLPDHEDARASFALRFVSESMSLDVWSRSRTEIDVDPFGEPIPDSIVGRTITSLADLACQLREGARS